MFKSSLCTSAAEKSISIPLFVILAAFCNEELNPEEGAIGKAKIPPSVALS